MARVMTFEFPHVPASGPASGSDARPIYGTVQLPSAACIEIGAGSEIDSCIVECPSGRFVLTLGCPLSIPTEGPFVIRPVRVMPFNNGAAVYLTTQMIANPPKLALNVYADCAPSLPTRRRGPAYRRRTSVATTGTGAFSTLFECPWYGRDIGTFHMPIIAAGTVTVRFRSNTYDAPLVGVGGGAGAAGGIAGGTNNTVIQSAPLKLDAAGATTLTVDTSTAQTVTIAAESCDTISIEVQDDSSVRTMNFYARLEDAI